MEWINVKDERPPYYCPKLVRCKSNNDDNRIYNAWLAVGDDGKDMYTITDTDHLTQTDVTHWMPLPSPPKENQT